MEQEEKGGEDTSSFADAFHNPATDGPREVEAGQPETIAPEPEPDEKGDPAPEPDAGQPRDDHGRFASKAPEAEPAAPPAAEREPQHVPVAALKDERTKRQALEAENAQMRAFIAQMQRQPPAQQPAPQQPADKPDPMGALLDNPDGFVEQRAQQVARQMVAPLEQQMFADRLHFSVQRAKSAPDFEEADALVNAALQAAPPDVQQRIAEQMRRHPDPGQWVLEQGRAIKDRQEFQRWKAAQSQPPQPAAPPPVQSTTPPLPASLANARGIGASRPTDNPGGSPFAGIWRD